MTVKERKERELLEVEIGITVLDKFIADYTNDRAELKTRRAQLKKDIQRLKTEPEKQDFILRVDTAHFEVTDRWIEDAVENMRAFAYPKVWGLEGKGPGKPPVFRIEFEIEASERSACEYLQDVRDQMMYAGIDSGNSTIEAVR